MAALEAPSIADSVLATLYLVVLFHNELPIDIDIIKAIR